MKKNTIAFLIIIVISLTSTTKIFSQYVYDAARHCYIDESTDECIPNTILSALPFLRIVPDARGAALGDAGIAISADPSAMHFNAAKLAMSEKEFEVSTTYTPWLKNLGLNDIYLAYLAGYNKFDKIQAIGYSIRYFSLGELEYRDNTGVMIGKGNPAEFEVALSYSRKLSDKFAAGLTGKFVYSNLASGQTVDGVAIESAKSFAIDISLYHKTKFNLGGYKTKMNTGLTISNVGSPITYTNSKDKDFLPQNLGIGTSLDMQFDDYNSMSFILDLNKLLLPTPIVQLDSNGIAHYEKFDGSPFDAIFASFSDAEGGFTEEIREISASIGVEYWYDKQFAIRAGYFYEHPLKGDRQFLTLGLGLNYNVYGMSISYLVPTNNTRNPLDGTLRFSFSMDFTKGKFKEQ